MGDTNSLSKIETTSLLSKDVVSIFEMSKAGDLVSKVR